jgi:hypothetical protein
MKKITTECNFAFFLKLFLYSIARLNPDGCDELHVGETGSLLLSAGDDESDCALIGGLETGGWAESSLRVAGVLVMIGFVF